jgi:fructose-1,6-bisphosphatase/inositol monophosphatase family enzyme
MSLSVDIDAVTTIIREVAAEKILPRFRNLQVGDVAFKLGDDPVTIADKEAESELSARLSGLLKGSKTVGEEAFAANPSILEAFFGESPVWVIDPIDGTRNFVRGSPQFGVIISLAQQNQLVAGWIYDPTSNEVVAAERGSGAWYRGQRLRIAPPVPLANMHGFLGDRLLVAYEGKKPMGKKPVFEKMRAAAHEYPRLVLDRAHFGKEEQQVHFRISYAYATPWDDGAGVLIHREAGGYSAFWDGTPYQPSEMNRGLALAPDKESWQVLKAWCRTFTDLP